MSHWPSWPNTDLARCGRARKAEQDGLGDGGHGEALPPNLWYFQLSQMSLLAFDPLNCVIGGGGPSAPFV